jgi:hypothetical protein
MTEKETWEAAATLADKSASDIDRIYASGNPVMKELGKIRIETLREFAVTLRRIAHGSEVMNG